MFQYGSIIYREQEEVEEMYFVMQGKYDVGYEFNNQVKFKLQFGDRTAIASYALANMVRISFTYRSHSELQCLALRKRSW